MTPLLNHGAGEPGYLTPGEAIQHGGLHVTEVSSAGSVPELQVLNREPKAVLMLDGEELLGAKQNRIVNLSILIPPNSKTVIPVTCVEHGRWAHRSEEFQPGPTTLFATARASKMRHVSDSMAATGSRAADQGEVWNNIEGKAQRMDVHSETGAMRDIFEDRREAIERFVEGLAPVEHQVGAVFALHGKERGVELFDTPATWSRLMPKIVRSWGLEAIDERTKRDVEKAPECASLLESLANEPWKTTPSLGLGSDARLAAKHLTGGALIVAGEVVHLGAFRVEDTDDAGRHRPHGRRVY